MRAVMPIAVVALTALSASALAGAFDPPAKTLFGELAQPSAGEPRPIGSYAKGCMAGAEALPIDGPRWRVMRLSRNRNWGMPELISYLEKLSEDAARGGWPGLLIGDMAQPRGGPMVSGHASHQIGLDADVWLTPMPDHVMSAAERETMGAPSMLIRGKLAVDPAKWTPAHTELLKRAASRPEVARIFVSAAIKKTLCEAAGSDRAWLRKIRPWYDHEDHFHVRLSCPPGLTGCIEQAPPPAGDGCGDELASWFKPPPPPKPSKGPYRGPREITLSDLPAACEGVLTSGPNGLTPDELKLKPEPRLRPVTN